MRMDFQKAEPGSDDSETSLSHASAASGLPVGLREALADPIVKALMAADGVDPKGLEELLRRTAARLAQDQKIGSSRAIQRQRAVRGLSRASPVIWPKAHQPAWYATDAPFDAQRLSVAGRRRLAKSCQSS